MPSTSEVGHAKNVANFEDLISVCTGYGATYNPTNTAITLPALNAVYTNANTLMTNVNNSAELYNTAVGSRRAEFEPLKALATKLVNAYIAVNPGKAKIANAKTINAKIQGTKLKKVKEVPTTGGSGGGSGTGTGTSTGSGSESTTKGITITLPSETPKDISASQQSYDQLIEHFSKLVILLAADPLFIPNETALTTTSLNAKLLALKTSNTNFGNAYTQVTNTRIARNHGLYDPNTGLCDIAQTTKSYVKSIYGATAPEFKMINKIKFKSRKP